MNKEQLLERLADRFILTVLASETMAQRMLFSKIHMSEVVKNTKDIVNDNLSNLYQAIIDELTENEIEGHMYDEDNDGTLPKSELTTNEEWFNLVDELKQDIKKDYLYKENKKYTKTK